VVPSENQRLIVAHIQVANSRVARSVLFSIGQPLGADVPTKAEANEDWQNAGNPSFSITLLRPPDRLAPGATYSTAGLVTDATADELRASDVGTMDVGGRYTQLPDDLPQRVRALAEEVTAGQTTSYDKVKAVERTCARSHRLPASRGAAGSGRGGLLPLRVEGGLLRLPRLGDGGAPARRGHPLSPGGGLCPRPDRLRR